MTQQKWLVDGAKVIDIGLVRRLKVGLIRGQIDIVGHDEPSARVEVHSVEGKELKIVVDGDTLEIDHPQLRWDDWLEVFRTFGGRARADVSVVVPHDVALKFGVVSASGLVSGLSGDASLSTVSGDLVVDGCTGAMTINSVSGEVGVRDHTGEVKAHSVSGDFTVSGTIDRFSADTVSGDVFLDIAGAPDKVRVNTVSGDVTTRLGADVATHYRINTASGRLQLDESEITGVRGAYTGRYGKLDGQYLDFSASTVSGNVSVLHKVTV